MSAVRALLVAASCAVMGYGAWLVLHLGHAIPKVLEWLVGGAVLHDAVLAPLVLGAGWVLVRARVARPVRVGLQVALVVGGATLLATMPTWLGKPVGHVGGEPGLLPQDYLVGVVVVGVVSVASGVVSALVVARRGPPVAERRGVREAAARAVAAARVRAPERAARSTDHELHGVRALVARAVASVVAVVLVVLRRRTVKRER